MNVMFDAFNAVYSAEVIVMDAISLNDILSSRGECPELCVSELAHAGFRYGHALKRSSNMIAN
jgi:hypothetical protein